MARENPPWDSPLSGALTAAGAEQAQWANHGKLWGAKLWELRQYNAGRKAVLCGERQE